MNETAKKILGFFAQRAKERLFGSGGVVSLTRKPRAEKKERSWLARATLAAATLLSLALLVGLSISAFGLLFASLATIYLLLSRAFGISLRIDPQAILRRAQASVPPQHRPN